MKDYALLLKPEGPVKKHIQREGISPLKNYKSRWIEIYPYRDSKHIILVNEGCIARFAIQHKALDTVGKFLLKASRRMKMIRRWTYGKNNQ